MSKAVEKQIESLIAPDLDALGYDLVRVQLVGGGKYAVLQIMAERHDGVGMTVEDCVSISKKVTLLFEGQPELSERYDLEVSSPGIDRPLIKVADYSRYQGHVAKIELGAPLNGKKRFQGAIVAVKDNEIVVQADKDLLHIPFAAIEKAKLVLTDELLKAASDQALSLIN